MTNIITIYNNKEFFEYPQLNKLLKEVRKDPKKDIQYTPELLAPRVISKNCFVRALKSLVVKIKKLWHSLCLLCSKSYKSSFENAASKIQEAKVSHIKAFNDAETAKQLEEQKLKEETRTNRISELEAQIANYPKEHAALEANLIEVEEIHKKLIEETNPYGDLNQAIKTLINERTTINENWEKDPDSEKLQQEFVEKQTQWTTLILLQERFNESTNSLEKISTAIETLTKTHDKNNEELTALKAEVPSLPKEKETNRQQLARLIDEGTETTETRVISQLFEALFNNFTDSEENIENIIPENKNNLTVCLKKPWRIWSPSTEAADGVIIKIHKTITFSLKKNTIEISSNDTTGLQIYITKPYIGNKIANLNQFLLTTKKMDDGKMADYVDMAVSVSFISLSIKDSYEGFRNLWTNKCHVVPDEFTGHYPAAFLEFQKASKQHLKDIGEVSNNI